MPWKVLSSLEAGASMLARPYSGSGRHSQTSVNIISRRESIARHLFSASLISHFCCSPRFLHLQYQSFTQPSIREPFRLLASPNPQCRSIRIKRAPHVLHRNTCGTLAAARSRQVYIPPTIPMLTACRLLVVVEQARRMRLVLKLDRGTSLAPVDAAQVPGTFPPILTDLRPRRALMILDLAR